jgi:hypothetical protein
MRRTAPVLNDEESKHTPNEQNKKYSDARQVEIERADFA